MSVATGLRERKLAETRQAITAVAMRLFAAKGFDATSVDEIAEVARVAPRTFYRYFPTKEDVVFNDTVAEQRFRQGMAVRRPGETDVEHVARALCEAMVEDADRIESL